VTRSGIAYDVRGSGPPLLWIPGYIVAAASLRKVLARFTDHYTCITFDHRGSGRSRASLRPMTTGQMARDAASVLRHLGIESAHVYGASLGGMVAQELAIQAPHRVRTLILGGTSAGGITAVSPPVSALLSGVWNATSTIPGASRVGVLGPAHQGWAAATHDSTHRLQRVRVPTLVLHGGNDKLIPLANAADLARLIPGAELRVIRGAGHLFLFDSTTATSIVRRWLDARRTVGAHGHRSTLTVARDIGSSPWRLAMGQSLPSRRLFRARQRRGR
jgi:3-oxoadipate enol-lactonase